MSKHWLWLLAILFPLLAAAQKLTVEKVAKAEINDDETYSAKLDHPAYGEAGPVVLLDGAHGNSHFEKAFVKLASADGYRVVASSEPFTYEALSKAKVLVIMNPGLFMPLAWHQNPQPLFSDVEATAIRDWVAAGGSLLFASGSREAQSGDMLLHYLGVAFSQDILNDLELRPAKGAAQPAGPQLLTFTREKQMLTAHSILGGRAESERVNMITLDHAGPIVKAPDNAIVLLHCSAKALIIPRDWLLKKQEVDARNDMTKSGAAESQAIMVPSVSTPAPEVPVAMAFTLGQGRVAVVGNSSFLSSVTHKSVLQGSPISWKTGLGDGDNQKFTLNIMHWLSGLLE